MLEKPLVAVMIHNHCKWSRPPPEEDHHWLVSQAITYSELRSDIVQKILYKEKLDCGAQCGDRIRHLEMIIWYNKKLKVIMKNKEHFPQGLEELTSNFSENKEEEKSVDKNEMIRVLWESAI